MADIKVYGADWCEDTQSTRRFLESNGIVYDYINIDRDRAAAKWVMDHNGGKEKKPTLDVKGQVLTSPSETQLMETLQAQGIIG